MINKTIPSHQQMALHLLQCHLGLSYEEACDELGITLDTSDEERQSEPITDAS
ncbi:hypothetical protein V9N52_004142 [Vibrio navarrensis]